MPIRFEKQHVPSWSWMAYSGRIEYGSQRGWLKQSENLRLHGEITLDVDCLEILAPVARISQGLHIGKDETLKGHGKWKRGWMDEIRPRQRGRHSSLALCGNWRRGNRLGGLRWCLLVRKTTTWQVLLSLASGSCSPRTKGQQGGLREAWYGGSFGGVCIIPRYKF